MSSGTQGYDDGPDDSSAWAAIEASRRSAVTRDILVRMGDCFLEIARIYARLDCRNTPRACSACLKAANAYQCAGLTRAGQVAWRWARLLHQRRWRDSIE